MTHMGGCFDYHCQYAVVKVMSFGSREGAWLTHSSECFYIIVDINIYVYHKDK